MRLLMPEVNDIILGRGGISTNHVGNIRFRREIERHKIQYQQIEGRFEKGEFLTSILQDILASGRRFYKKDKNTNKYYEVGLDDKFGDRHFILKHKILALLSRGPARVATTTTTTTTTAAIANGDSSNSGKFLYFQTMREDNKNGHLRMTAPKKEKDRHREILSEGRDVVSQLNITVDCFQLYIIRGLHKKPHAVEDDGQRDECSRVLQQQHHATVIELSNHSVGDGVEVLDGQAANYTSRSPMLREVVNTAFPSHCMEDLAEYIYTNGEGHGSRDFGEFARRLYIGFGQIQISSETFEGQKMPTFNSNLLQHLPPCLQNSLAKILSFSQKKLDELLFSSGRNPVGEDNSRSDYVRSKWQQHYDARKLKVDWDFEFVDINMRSCEDKLLRHCDYKNDWRSNNDGCAVFSYSVQLRGKKYRVVIVMTSRYSVGGNYMNQVQAK